MDTFLSGFVIYCKFFKKLDGYSQWLYSYPSDEELYNGIVKLSMKYETYFNFSSWWNGLLPKMLY